MTRCSIITNICTLTNTAWWFSWRIIPKPISPARIILNLLNEGKWSELTFLGTIQNFSLGGFSEGGYEYFAKVPNGGIHFLNTQKKTGAWQNSPFAQLIPPPWMPLSRNSPLLPWSASGTLGGTHFWQRIHGGVPNFTKTPRGVCIFKGPLP